MHICSMVVMVVGLHLVADIFCWLAITHTHACVYMHARAHAHMHACMHARMQHNFVAIWAIKS